MTSTVSTTAQLTANPQPRSKGPTITLAICLAAGIAAGIGLARPGTPADETPANAGIDQRPAAGTGYGSQDRTEAQNATPQAASAAAINISGFAFGNPITVAAGAAVTVTNSDAAAHTLTSNDDLFDTGSIGAGAASTVAVPGQPGTYSFFCSIHPSMQGSITVTQ